MWVVKLGGSLIGSPELKSWLDAFAQFGDGKVVIVPGGGLFADAVREAQAKTAIADATAHQMAVMAMDQYATLMVGLNADLVTASSELEIAERGWQHRAVIWKPSAMVLADHDLPMNWDLTSDSLAAWLASKLNAQHLLMVKSMSLSGSLPVSRNHQSQNHARYHLQSLIEEGVVDPYFGQYLAHQIFKTWLVGKDEFSKINSPITHQSRPMVGVEVISTN